MKMNRWVIMSAAVLALSTQVFASATRILDGQAITNGAATITLPTTSDTLMGRNTTDTLTNKTLTAPVINSPTGIVKADVGLSSVDNTSDASKNSASVTLTNKTMTGSANTFSLIPVGAIGNGSVLSGTNTGDLTAAAFGSTPNANGFSLSGQAFNLQPADATHPGGLLSADWVTFNAKLSATLNSAKIFVGNGSNVATGVTMSGDTTIDNAGAVTIGAKKVQASKLDSGAATSGQAFLADGSGGGSYQSIPGSAPAITGSTGSPSLIVAVTGITFSGSNYMNIKFIAGTAAPITVTANPQIAAASSVGQELVLMGEDATNTVTLADGTGLSLNGSWVGGLNSVLGLMWDGSAWVEQFRR